MFIMKHNKLWHGRIFNIFFNLWVHFISHYVNHKHVLFLNGCVCFFKSSKQFIIFLLLLFILIICIQHSLRKSILYITNNSRAGCSWTLAASPFATAKNKYKVSRIYHQTSLTNQKLCWTYNAFLLRIKLVDELAYVHRVIFICFIGSALLATHESFPSKRESSRKTSVTEVNICLTSTDACNEIWFAYLRAMLSVWLHVVLLTPTLRGKFSRILLTPIVSTKKLHGFNINVRNWKKIFMFNVIIIYS